MIIDLSKVVSVYSGKNGRCCCGCAGKYTYPSALREQASKKRGYPVTNDEVNDRTVRAIVRKVQEQIDAGNIEFQNEDFVSTVVGKRLYVVYFLKEAA